MKIVAKLLPNNKFQIRRYRIADGYGRPPSGDTTSESRNTALCARYLRQAEHITKTIKAASVETQHPYSLQREPVILSDGKPYSKTLQCHQAIALGCSLPETMVYTAPPNIGVPQTIEHLNYFEAAQKRLRALDLLKKSQHAPKKHSSWGKAQRPKSLRYQAGERLKEAGAVVDRFCGAKNSTMVTLTLPGDNATIFDALARWSGYVVNRLTQVFRRVSTEEIPLYWFFVWEHQKRGALHMHWCIGWNVPQGFREEICQKLIDKWYCVLFEIGKRENLDMYQRRGFRGSWKNHPEKWQSDMVQIDRSVAAYFAKYCNKNSQTHSKYHVSSDENISDSNRKTRKKSNRNDISYPTRYWGSASTIKSWCGFLGQSRTYIAGCREEAECLSCNLRSLATVGFEFVDVHVNEFEIRLVNGNKIVSEGFTPSLEAGEIAVASGVVETYILRPEHYPRFWSHCMHAILETPVYDKEMYAKFMGTGVGVCMDAIELPVRQAPWK